MLTPNQEKLIYWINERESIRKLKLTDTPKPWSSDPIFQVTYFTNVNREDDKVTKWVRQNWTYPRNEWQEECYKYYDLAMIAARIFNKIETLHLMQQPVETHNWLEHITEVLTTEKDKGNKIWSGAYIISTNGKKIDKLTYCIELLRKIAKQPYITANCKTLEQAHKALMKVEGLASFLAAQVVADLKNTIDHPLNSAPDWWTFSSYGPGSLRGLSWFWEETVTPKTYQKHIVKANEILQWELNDDILDILCMQNLQNCFCEFDKYMRILNKTGRSKRKYAGV